MGPSFASLMHGSGIPSLSEFGLDAPAERWKYLFDLFGKLFLSDVGLERESFLAQMAGFKVKEKKLREDMEALRRSRSQGVRDLRIHVPRDREGMLAATYMCLLRHSETAGRSTDKPFITQNVRVTFKDEPGEGVGVARAYYVTIAQAAVVNEPIPSRKSLISGGSSEDDAKICLTPQQIESITSTPELQRKRRLHSVLIPILKMVRPFT
jgi:hypothetical protein